MRNLTAVLLGGFTAGVFDITYAILAWAVVGRSPQKVLQSIASGLIGRVAYSGGLGTAILGLALHFAIAIGMAAGFVLLARLAPRLPRRPIVSGMCYGLLLFTVMNYVVMPLSAIHRFGHPEGFFLVGALYAHTMLVGVPIALIASQVRKQPSN